MADEDFTKLIRDLGEVPKHTGEFLQKAGQVSGRNVKDAWRDKLEGASHIPHGSRTITYDVNMRSRDMSVKIGPERGRRQARFVKIVETGAPTLGARGYGAGALQENEADFIHGCNQAIDDALKKANL